MKRQTIGLAVIGIAFLFPACSDKDPINETEHPEKARITVVTDWNNIGAGIEKPANYVAVVNETEHGDISSSKTHTFPDVFPGTYTAYLYNTAAKIRVDNKMATVNTVAVLEEEANIRIEPIPDWLFTGRFEETVEADRDYTFTVAMKQQVRELTLILELTGQAVSRVEHLTGSLSGVAGSLDLESDTHGSSSSVTLTFTKITDGADATKWAATVRLLGITGGEQKLMGKITFTDGSPNDMPLESDLSSSLTSFNADKKTPLTLTGQIIKTPVEESFSATITNWQKKWGGEGVAN